MIEALVAIITGVLTAHAIHGSQKPKKEDPERKRRQA